MRNTDAQTRDVARLRFLHDNGELTEREYLRAGALVFGEEPSQLRTNISVALMTLLNLMVFITLIMALLSAS